MDPTVIRGQIYDVIHAYVTVAYMYVAVPAWSKWSQMSDAWPETRGGLGGLKPPQIFSLILI